MEKVHLQFTETTLFLMNVSSRVVEIVLDYFIIYNSVKINFALHFLPM